MKPICNLPAALGRGVHETLTGDQVYFPQKFDDLCLVRFHANRLITVGRTALAVAEANGMILLAASSVSCSEKLQKRFGQ